MYTNKSWTNLDFVDYYAENQYDTSTNRFFFHSQKATHCFVRCFSTYLPELKIHQTPKLSTWRKWFKLLASPCGLLQKFCQIFRTLFTFNSPRCCTGCAPVPWSTTRTGKALHLFVSSLTNLKKANVADANKYPRNRTRNAAMTLTQ